MANRFDGEKTEGNGRDSKGRFTAGNSGGPGRPRRETERQYLATISDACPPDAWREIVKRAVEDAKAGDPKARDWLAAYLVGRPASSALTLHKLAVEEHGNSDPVTRDAMMHSLFDASWQLDQQD
jgi:hypothetical protein